MIGLELREQVEDTNKALEEKVNRQVAEIMEAARMDEEQAGDFKPTPEAWNFSMPFAGVRYYRYD